jgi:DNA-binding transcriptional regulator YhcF (GntR family)
MGDKAEILSDAEVDFLLTADKSEAPAPPPDGGGDQAVTMRGDLEQINLADIFQTLSMSKMEGVLRIRNPLEERQVHCRDGFLRAYVPGRLATRRLGQRLVQAGLVQTEQLRATLVQQRKDKKPLGKLLIEAGLVTQEAIDEIVATQVAEDVFALFTWRHGTFEFWKGEPNESMRAQFASCPEYEVSSLLLEVARRSDEWASIHDALGSLDDVPAIVREVTADDELGELHRELLPDATGRFTYREIADHTTCGLFEVARAARDLVRAGILANIDEQAMVALADNDAQVGQNKRALVLVQTLRERPGDRSIEILQQMAGALEKAGERRIAGSLLLEAAQRHSDSQIALDLARAARALTPHDVGTLSFLRTVLIAHSPAESPELEKCSLDLIDALIEADLVPTALEIIEDARRTGTAQPPILMREVRARQKGHDVPGAVRVLEELAAHYDAAGQTQLANEAYSALLRLDRSRKDVQKLLAARRRTRMARIVRLSAATVGTLMLTLTGLVVWHQHEYSAAIATADKEISDLLRAGDRATARAKLEYWTGKIGDGEATEDLKNRVAFAEASEAGRQQKQLRTRVNRELAAAAAALAKGEISDALHIYDELASEPKLLTEVTDVSCSRLDAVLGEITQVAKGLQSRVPSRGSSLLDRQDVLRCQADLYAVCRPELITLFEQLDATSRASRLPAFLGADRIERVAHVLTEGHTMFAHARELANTYLEALARNDQQRQLDPLFKQAVDRERALDFAGALAQYRDLERQAGENRDMRAHFRDRVARNATIVRLLEAMQAATAAGDFATAQQQLRALRMSFPGVPFERVAQLPLRVESCPTGARVTCNDRELGVTPLTLSRLCADTVRVTVHVDGFRDAETTVTGDEPGSWFAHLVLPPARSWRHGSALEVAPTRTSDGTIVVDRAGNVSAVGADGTPRWTFRSGDLSGLLTAPRVFDRIVLVGSLDGELRAIDLATGALRWSIPDLPTEIAPLLIEERLYVATTDKHLHGIDIPQRARQSIELREQPAMLLRLPGGRVGVLGEKGMMQAFEGKVLTQRWQRDLPARSSPQACLAGGVIVVADDRGRVVGVDASTGDLRWQRELGGEGIGAPVVANNDVWVATRTDLHRLDATMGNTRGVIAPDEGEWGGAIVAFGNRLVVPVRSGLQVLDAASGAQRYLLPASKRAHVWLVEGELWIVEPDHSVQVFDRLR